MNDTQFHRLQLAQFDGIAERLTAVAGTDGFESLGSLAERFRDLSRRPAALLDEGPSLVFQLLTIAPGAAQDFPRDLIWYLGGECLHFMPDDEIARYSALDDDRRAAAGRGETFPWEQARSQVALKH